LNTLPDKLPPQDLEAEQAVLGAILCDPDCILIAADIITATDFYRATHGIIFNRCMDCYQDGGLDFVLLTQRLRTNGELDEIGGLAYLSQTANCTPTAANIAYHAKIVKEKSVLRKIIAWGHGINSKIHDGIDNISSFLSDMEHGIIDISQLVTEKQKPQIVDIMRRINTTWEKEAQGEISHIPTSILIDKLVPRYCPGHYWLIAGYTSVGKSTYLAQTVVDVCEEGAKVLIFSVEDRQEDKALKLIANLSNVSQKRLIEGNFQNERSEVFNAQKQLKDWGVLIYDDIYTVDEIRLKTKKHKMQEGVDIVCIDFAQNLMGQGSQYEVLRYAAIMLQKMAKELEVTVILLSQVSNEGMRGDTNIIAAKGAGELVSAADVVIWLSRHKGKDKSQWLDCDVKKNRPFGPTGVIPLQYNNRFTKIEWRETR